MNNPFVLYFVLLLEKYEAVKEKSQKWSDR